MATVGERAMRAKVKITAIEKQGGAAEKLTFAFPAKGSAYPADGSDEDQQFARFTPSAALTLTVTNQNLLDRFAIGDTFYLDFIRTMPT